MDNFSLKRRPHLKNKQKYWKQKIWTPKPRITVLARPSSNVRRNWSEPLVTWSFHCALFGRPRRLYVSLCGLQLDQQWSRLETSRSASHGWKPSRRIALGDLCVFVFACVRVRNSSREGGLSYCVPIIYWHSHDTSHPAHNQQVLEFIVRWDYFTLPLRLGLVCRFLWSSSRFKRRSQEFNKSYLAGRSISEPKEDSLPCSQNSIPQAPAQRQNTCSLISWQWVVISDEHIRLSDNVSDLNSGDFWFDPLVGKPTILTQVFRRFFFRTSNQMVG
jgi:hypothetical protein